MAANGSERRQHRRVKRQKKRKARVKKRTSFAVVARWKWLTIVFYWPINLFFINGLIWFDPSDGVI